MWKSLGDGRWLSFQLQLNGLEGSVVRGKCVEIEAQVEEPIGKRNLNGGVHIPPHNKMISEEDLELWNLKLIIIFAFHNKLWKM